MTTGLQIDRRALRFCKLISTLKIKDMKMPIFGELPNRSGTGWLDAVVTALGAGRNARSVRLARAKRANLFGKQTPYRSDRARDYDD